MSKNGGAFYLLYSSKGVFKYGVTEGDPEKRKAAINHSHGKKYGEFKLIDSFTSKALFIDEREFRKIAWDNHMGPIEFFMTPDYDLVIELFNNFKALKNEQT